tara:strand:- start:105 stop:854 length:750 start_codon:yes stop_codon:yes gene_type:complete
MDIKNISSNKDVKKKFVRHFACKTRIKSLFENEYIIGNEENPNHFIDEGGTPQYRINIMAIILSKEKRGSISNILIDDGSGQIYVRSFEENKNIEKLQIGNVVLVIGKLRLYNQERYISPEIIKLTEVGWLKARSLELGKLERPVEDLVVKLERKKEGLEEVEQPQKAQIPVEENKNGNEVAPGQDSEEESLLPAQKTIQLIKEMDTGEGVLIDRIIENSTVRESEKIIENLLESGEIFQISPGKVKVL